MKTITLSFVEYKVVKTSFSEINKHQIEEAFGISSYSEFNEVENFETTLEGIREEYDDFDFKNDYEFDLISDRSWIEYELPALLSAQVSLVDFPSQIIDSIKFSEVVDFIWSSASISDANEGIINLFPESNEDYERIILFNHFIYQDLFEGGCLSEGLEQAILERRHVGL